MWNGEGGGAVWESAKHEKQDYTPEEVGEAGRGSVSWDALWGRGVEWWKGRRRAALGMTAGAPTASKEVSGRPQLLGSPPLP